MEVPLHGPVRLTSLKMWHDGHVLPRVSHVKVSKVDQNLHADAVIDCNSVIISLGNAAHNGSLESGLV